MEITIGCDPELFVTCADGQVISAHTFIPGDKESPFPVMNGAVQKDGVAAEFNIDPVSNEDQWLYNINSVMSSLKTMIPNDTTLSATPVAKFDPAYLFSLPDSVLELGCDPDFNAYTGGCNARPCADKPMRTGAGHVHVGWTSDEDGPAHIMLCQDIVKQLDVFLGLPSLLYDDDVERRSMYGKAGCFRPKSYGVEYRTLSNKWLATEELKAWVYRNTMLAMEQFIAGNWLYEKYSDVQDIINTSDVERALIICKEEGIPYVR